MSRLIEAIVSDLQVARSEKKQIKRLVGRYPDFNLEQGYQVCARLDSNLRSKGHEPVGRKIGFTNPATWDEFGLETPIWAHIYQRSVRFDDGSAIPKVSLRNLVQPRIETELVLQVNDRIGEIGTDSAELVGALDWIAIGFEIVQCHYPDWQFSAAEAVADFCLHSELIVGPRVPLDRDLRVGLTQKLEAFQVELLRNGKIQATGSGKLVLGSPLKALAFLLRLLDSQLDAPGLSAGEIVTTGTMTPILPLRASENWSVQVSGLDLPALSIETVAEKLGGRPSIS